MTATQIADLMNDIGQWCLGLIILNAVVKGVLLSIHGRTR